jgi:hypothetical protein
MKKLFSFAALGLALVCISCNKDEMDFSGPVNEIIDQYTEGAMEQITLTTLSKKVATWSSDRRFFDLEFSGTGVTLSTRLVGYEAALAGGQYMIAPEASSQIGNAVSEYTKVDGKAVSAGFVTVNRNGNKYTVTTHVTENGKDAKVLSWTGDIAWPEDPAAVKLTVVQQAQSNKANGVNSLTLQLATDGISSEMDWTTYQTVWTGEGGYLALDIYSDDGYLHDGNYTACAEGGVINAGEFGIGYDTVMHTDWGDFPMSDWGTCWWAVKDGAATATKITGGLVAVSSRKEKVDDKNITIWTIKWGQNYPEEYVFEGQIPALTKPDKPAGSAAPTHLYTDVVTPGDGIDTHAITITDQDGNEVAYLELLTANGADDLSGDYPSTSYAGQPGQMRDGYNFPDWGISGGSYYIEAGEKVYIGAGAATVTVTKIATGAYRFTCQFFDYPAAGPDYVPGEGGNDDVSGDVVLKLDSGLSYTMEDVTAGNTDASQAPLSGVTLWRVTVSDASGVVAAFDLGTDAGSENLAGTYTVMSYPDAPGKAGNGWGFAAWGMFGGCYFKVDGAYYFIPADATITVTDNGGLLKIRFEGPVQKDDYSDGGQGGLLLNNVAKA